MHLVVALPLTHPIASHAPRSESTTIAWEGASTLPLATMAPTSHGRGGPPGRESVAHASLANGPPPSTLAAQLVENMSPSVRSSRPDETAELKKFFAIIESVSNQPAVLASHADRVEHNHMLIYVYARVVLEGPKWDDPFADRAHLRTEALRAINFIKVTVRETPEVLVVTSPGTAFIFRGEEPLWLWVLPKVLKMLGHPQCLDVTAAVEGLFQELYLVICQHGFLWPLASRLRLYLRSNVNGKAAASSASDSRMPSTY